MNRKNSKKLYQKYIDGECTLDEIRLLDASFVSYLRSQQELPQEQQLKEADGRIRAALENHIEGSLRNRNRRIKIIYYYAAAAVLLSFTVLSVWFITPNYTGVEFAEIDALPGGNRATLTLTDGQELNLSEAQSGIIIEDSKQIVYSDGTAVLSLHEGYKVPSEGHTEMMQLATPQGGTYQLTLPDGSRIWLNAATVLRYPAHFTADNREVHLMEGEAYFEIAKRYGANGETLAPFKVVTASQTINVLGTIFNVSAYGNKGEVLTTLVEGSVKIDGNNRQAPVILKPGHQSRLNAGRFEIAAVNTLVYTAWKDGYFYFDKADVYSVMEQLKRWYNIDVQYDIDQSNDMFMGKIPRATHLNQVLTALQNTGIVFEWTAAGQLTVRENNLRK